MGRIENFSIDTRPRHRKKMLITPLMHEADIENFQSTLVPRQKHKYFCFWWWRGGDNKNIFLFTMRILTVIVTIRACSEALIEL